MSFSPQRSRAGNAFTAGSSQPSGNVQPGSVSAARERLRAVQAVRAQASMNEKASTSMDSLISPQSPPIPPKSPKRPWAAPTYSPMSRERTYAQDYNPPPQSDAATEPSWPLPASRYNPAAAVSSPKQTNRLSTQIASPTSPQTFYDASPQTSPQNLKPPRSAFGRALDYSSDAAPSPSVSRGVASTSSNGSIPDFPLPTSQYQSGRRSQNNAPPGRSRRGPSSSYYSQMSGPFGVSPIPEESNSRTTNSYASSNVIPSAQMNDFYLEETPSDDEVSSMEFDWQKEGEKVDESKLVRQASLGRRQKPALTTIRSGENLRAPATTPTVPRQVPPARATRMSQVASILDGESVLLDASSSEHTRDQDGRSVATDFYDPWVLNQGTLGRLGSLRDNKRGSTAERRQSRLATLGDRVGSRRPPPLDVEAVREAEARASLTSLPDLIRRATRLAANLDRGRTASRLGVDWMLHDDDKPRNGYGRHPSEGSSLSGMLRSFPPPVAMLRGQTPSDTATAEELYKNVDLAKLKAAQKENKRKKQICGFSRKAFYSILIVVFFLVAAAVLLPVFLIVLPKKNATPTSTTVPVASALAKCQKTDPCSNGGTVVINSGQSCGCVCTNGFTGTKCTTQSNDGCTTIAASGTNSASVGTQVPGLIQAAQQKYDIPLDATQLTSAFAANNMTCTTENAIVTFAGSADQAETQSNQVQANVDIPPHVNQQDQSGLDYASTSSVATLIPEPATTTGPTGSAATATATGSASGATASDATASPTTSGASTTTGSSPSSTASSLAGVNATAEQFAEVGILFVLQDSRSVAAASTAQENLSQYFESVFKSDDSMHNAKNITLGNGYFIDLVSLIVTLRNDTRYGVGVNFNGTAT